LSAQRNLILFQQKIFAHVSLGRQNNQRCQNT